MKIVFLNDRIASISYSDTGKSVPILELEPEELMRFFGPEREQRRLVSIDQVPQHVIHAILAAEDIRFYRHHGLDPSGMLRALYTNLRHGAIRQGGSTITQQLAKNYFLTPEKNLSRKIKEMLMSLTMELMYEKDEILEIYLNEIYLGQKVSIAINGLGEASFFYFNKDVGDLSVADAATIAGLIRAPNIYSPYVDLERCRNRRNTILETMYKHGWISQEELRSAASLPVKPAGFKVYGKKAPYFMGYLSQQLSELYSPESLTSLGLSIFTTLDTQVQMAAERALEKGLARLENSNSGLKRSEPQKGLQGVVIVMQPKTGYILAMVGGRNYSVSQFNRATQARRQPGSAFKPFVYLTGLDEFTPASMLSNQPISHEMNGKVWRPQNYRPVKAERISFRQALAHSVNLPTVDLAMRIGLDRIVRTSAEFRFSTVFKPYPSLSLGAYEVIPLELARAYCAFAADGLLPHSLSLKEVVDEKGDMLEQRHMTIERVTSPSKAFIMSSLLRSVVEEGTGRSLRGMGISFPVSGKTGTTNGFRDAWFVGYTPDILALVWVGFDDGSSIQASGSSAALPIWADLLNALPEYVSGEWFKKPRGVVKRVVCSETGKLAVRCGCPKPVEEVFLADHAPTESCPLHRSFEPLREIIEGVKDIIKNF